MKSPSTLGHHKAHHRLTACLLAALCACDTGAFCAQDTPQPSGNLDELADALLITPPTSSGPRHSYVVLANPEVESLRIYDTFDGSFLSGPNVYFPLSMRTGPSTRTLASTPEDGTRFFALDSSLGTISMARTIAEGEASAWTWVRDIATDAAPSSLAVQKLGETFRLYVALPQAGTIQVLEVDAEGENRSEIARITLADGASPHALRLEPSGRTLVVADAALAQVYFVDTTSWEYSTLALPAAANDVSTGRLALDDNLISIALILLREGNRVVALRMDFDDDNVMQVTSLGIVRLPALPATAFVPDLALNQSNPPVCCDDLPEHLSPSSNIATIATVEGDLFYAQIDNEFSLLDAEESAPAPLVNPNDEEIFTTPVGGEALRPALGIELSETEEDETGIPLGASSWTFTLEYEAPLSQLAGIRAEPSEGMVRVPGFSSSLFGLGLREGDLIEVQPDAQSGCTETLQGFVSSLEDDAFVLAELATEDDSCITNSENLLLWAFATESWVLSSSESGYLGRAFMPNPEGGATLLQGEGFSFTMEQSAAGPPLPRSRFEIPMSTNFAPVGLELSRTPSPALGLFGFGAGARVPTALVGGEIQIQTFEDDGSESAELSHRLWMTTSVGLLLQLEQGERDSANVQDFN